jgi:hypothetical protein
MSNASAPLTESTRFLADDECGKACLLFLDELCGPASPQEQMLLLAQPRLKLKLSPLRSETTRG